MAQTVLSPLDVPDSFVVKSVYRICMGLLLGSLFCSTDLCLLLMPVPYCFNYYSFVIQFEIRKCDVSSFIFFLKIAWTIWGLLWFCTNFRIICSISVKTAIGILVGIALNL